MSGISYIGFAINFGIQLILVRLLVPEDFGLFALGLSIANMLFIFFSFSFSMGVIQIQEAEDLLDTALWLSLISGVVILFIGGIISLILIRHYPFQSVLIFFIICVLQILQGCSSIYSASMEKEVMFKSVAVVRGIATNFSGIIAAVMAYAGLGMWSLVGREILSTALMFIGMILTASYSFGRRFNRQTAKKLLDLAYKRLFIRGLESAYFNGPIFLMGNFTSPEKLGFFTQAFYLAGLPNTFLSPIQQNVAFSVYSKISEQKEKLQQAFDLNVFVFVFILVPISVVIYLFPEQILTILYGEKWISASYILKSLSPYATLCAITICTVMLLYALNINHIIKLYYIMIMVFAFVVGVSFVMSGNLTLVCGIAYSLSIAIGFLLGLYFIKESEVDIKIVKDIIRPFVIALGVIIFWQMFVEQNIVFGNLNKAFSLLVITIVFVFLLFLNYIFGKSRVQYYLKYVVSNLFHKQN